MAVRDRRSLLWVILAVASACSSPGSSTPPGKDAGLALRPAPETRELPGDDKPSLPTIRPFDSGGDEAAALREVGAFAAWDAVLWRDRALMRRGQTGVVYGRLGQHDTDWILHDEIRPDYCLGVRFRPPAAAALSPGDRVVAWGAWVFDADHQWQWAAGRLEKLESVDSPAPHRPPLAIPAAPLAPDDASAPSARNGAGAIAFHVVARPTDFGLGWSIADMPGSERAARLLLPGEHRIYGGQMPPTDDEWWSLQIGPKYVVEVAKFRRRDGKIPVMRAVSVPIEISEESE